MQITLFLRLLNYYLNLLLLAQLNNHNHVGQTLEQRLPVAVQSMLEVDLWSWLLVSPRDRMGILSQTRSRRRLGGWGLFMLAPLTPLLIDLFSEWSLKPYCHLVNHGYYGSQDQASRTGTNECQAEVVGSAAPVHRVLYDVEGKDCHLLIHQDAKVITEEGSSESQSQEAADHQQSAQHHERYACVEDVRPVHHLPPGLGLHRNRHTVAAVHVEQNDDEAQAVTGQVGATTEPGESPSAMLPSRHQIPEERVENDGDHSNTKAGVTKVDVFQEFFHWSQVHLGVIDVVESSAAVQQRRMLISRRIIVVSSGCVAVAHTHAVTAVRHVSMCAGDDEICTMLSAKVVSLRGQKGAVAVEKHTCPNDP